MARKKTKHVATSGRTRMKELGRTEVVLWLDANELSAIDAAARGAKQKRATWIRTVAFHAAQKFASEQGRKRKRDAAELP